MPTEITFLLSKEENYDYNGAVLKNWINSINSSLNTVTISDSGSKGTLTKMDYMFNGCTNLNTVDLTYLHTERVSSLNKCFCGCYNLNTISNFNTSNVKYMVNTFGSCDNLTTIPNFDTSNVEDFNYAFYKCYNLINIPNLNLSKVNNLYSSFSACEKLESINSNLCNVIEGGSAFENCKNLVSVESNFCNLRSGFRMFANCYSLQNIPNLNLSNLEIGEQMYYVCPNLNGLGDIELPKLKNAPYMFASSGITNVSNVNVCNTINATGMFAGCNLLTSVSNSNMQNVARANNLFFNCNNLQSVYNVNLSNAYDLSGLFDNCSKLYLISNLITTNKVSRLAQGFRNCTNLEVLPNIDVSKVTNISSAFLGCKNLSSLNLWLPVCSEFISAFNTGNSSMSFSDMAFWNAVNIGRMFGYYLDSSISTQIVNLGILYGLGQNFRNCTPNSVYSTLDLYGVTNGQMLDLSLSELYNIGEAGYNFQQILVQGETYSNMSSEIKQDILDKGWKLIQMGTVCLTGDIKIQTENGLKEIKDIEVGDRIYTYNQETNRQNITEVTKTINHLTQQIYTFTLDNGEEIKCTARHQFLVNSDHFEELNDETFELTVSSKIDFMEARLISLEDKFITKSGDEISITNISIEDDEQYVYEINTDKGNNYMIGEDFIVVKQEVIED